MGNKIVFFEIEDWEKEFIKKALSGQEMLFSHLKAQETDSQFTDATVLSVFIYSSLNKETLSKFPNLKLIATRSTGYDHIDLSYCREKGIKVVNVPSYGASTVAEHTLALILAISRKLVPTVERSRRANFRLDGLRGFDLNEKTLGVVGAGKIGSKVIDVALAFGMKILIFARHPGENTERIKYVSFEELISSADIVSLHIPYTPETHHLINRENIKKFKKGSILINTARGQLVETQAILEGLESGNLAGAGLDVLEEEGNLKEERELLTQDFLEKSDIKTQLLNHMLLERENVLFTSHNAFNSGEALQQILEVTIDNITSFFTGSEKNVIS